MQFARRTGWGRGEASRVGLPTSPERGSILKELDGARAGEREHKERDEMRHIRTRDTRGASRAAPHYAPRRRAADNGSLNA